MPSSKTRQSRPHASFTSAPGRWLLNVAVPLLPVLACFLGGATVKWSEGIVVALFGVMLLINPPKVSLGWGINLTFLGLLLCAGTAFMPANWFLQPAWRTALVEDFGVILPGTLSPQPWISLGCFLSFLAGLSWLYYVSTLDLELRDVRTQLRTFAFGIACLTALCIALRAGHTALSFWHNERGFGPFPNRNQTANLFGITAIIILACGQEDIRHGRKRWILWLIALATIVAGIILDFSRAGVLLLVAGSAVWLGVFALRKGSAARIALGVSLVLVLLTVMLLFGGQTFERFNLRAGDTGVATDLRWAIFRDAAHLIAASPWCGIGLGNFDEVFAVFRDASLTSARTIHPESDWFWFCVEAGWPAIVLMILGIALFVWRVFPLREGTNQRFRVAALIAALLFAFHGVVDVSAHRVGTAFAALFLLGLSLLRPHELSRRIAVPIVFRLIGLILLVAGSAWLFATRYEKPLPGAVGVENEMRLGTLANRGRNFTETIQHSTRALGWAPLRWQIYFLRALGEVGARGPMAQAVDDFRRARFLEPNVYEVPFEEGNAWASAAQPNLALTAWREALRRAGPQRRPEVYGRMLAVARNSSPQLSQGLEELGMVHHDLVLIFLEHSGGAPFMTALQRFLDHDPTLQTMSAEEKVTLFKHWAERGDAAELVRTVEANPEWMPFAWRGVANYQAAQKDLRRAVEITRQYGEKPALPPAAQNSSIDQLRQALHANPDSYALGFQLYHEQMQQRLVDEALITVRHFTDLPGAPRYFHFLEAEAWAEKQDWERAWNARKKFDAAK
ncbi:MAG TPA: O-antigen ligase family protein [Chthoniobacterales bacterium]|nr:O-antigen ligase family protein [Chthoniobacterales bacterium]